jgi:UPF0755 protein
MKSLVKILLGLLLLTGGLALALIGAWNYYNAPPESSAEESTVFEIKEGEPVRRLSYRLEEMGLIRSARLFSLLTRIHKTQGLIKSGFYRIEPNMTSLEIHDVLVAGAQELKSVTLPEGWTSRRMAQKLEEAQICSAKSFLEATASRELLEKFKIPADSLEGYLFPDTYRFLQAYPAQKVVEHMVKAFFEQLKTVNPGYSELSPEELHRKVILASIVEREYRDKDETNLIASVFYNRLEKNMRLQSCATVVYVLTEEKGRPHPSKLTYSDLEVDSKFNTYREWGLPPAPISNPGSAALKGAMFPAETDYLFFLLQDPDAGKHVFTRTLADHNEAYRLYIKK